jgi:hypothetical protein
MGSCGTFYRCESVCIGGSKFLLADASPTLRSAACAVTIIEGDMV